MTRYRYNQQLNPPAPFTHITLQAIGDGTVLTEVPAQLDTAADMTVIPASFVEQLRLAQLDSISPAQIPLR